MQQGQLGHCRDSVPAALLGCVGMCSQSSVQIGYRACADLRHVGWCCLVQRRRQCCIATSIACLVHSVHGGTTHTRTLMGTSATALQYLSNLLACQLLGLWRSLLCCHSAWRKGLPYYCILLLALALQHCSTSQICRRLIFSACGTACSAATVL
jgi:hypothetical protein